MTHDPLCPWEPFPSAPTVPPRGGYPCQCALIAKVRADMIDKVIVSIQPHWEHGRQYDNFYGAGWLDCFENCESTIENLRDKIC
jgi:hypothetical protein